MIQVDKFGISILARYVQTRSEREKQSIEVEFDMYMEDLAAGKKKKSQPATVLQIEVNMPSESPFQQAIQVYRQALM